MKGLKELFKSRKKKKLASVDQANLEREEFKKKVAESKCFSSLFSELDGVKARNTRGI